LIEMDSKSMLYLFALASLTSLVIGEDNVTCYEGIANIRAHNAHVSCKNFNLNKVQCEECFTKGITLDKVGEDLTFGCKQEGMIASVGDIEFTTFCKEDLCNC
jgi:hypothetical protein